MKKFFDWLGIDERGQGMVEYGLILALVSVVAIVALLILGPKVAGIFTDVSDQLATTGAIHVMPPS